ncbi:hypothetical protein B7R21_19290 [Subtercola boreus]|uniref:Xaa-Pro dipeptidyl-peptidase C-terminal domain-containing protein n=1 Tax=Subtercola boreus TaxID=120213 RepID=A0A3E0VAW7_9MICO|nr:CocE/NonD family hydrolase [Subtercola boreus]RFA06628.1 hypothetical protein B7R21_19290 [Subtercola boreus]
MSAHTFAIRAIAATSALSLLLAVGIISAATASAAPPESPPAVITASGAVATNTIPVTHAENDRVPEGAAWTQHYFPSSDGSDVELHSDVLLPEGLAAGEKVPVILSVGSYFGHSGETSVEDFEHTGPSDRFMDLIEGTDLFGRGYALVMVDLRGFGGSTGCLDFMGDGEQADVKAAIDWAASQPWSTGAVGMYGKSYDAITGLVGNNLDQDALKAVVAQAPMWDLYRSMRSNGVPRSPIVDTSRSYNDIATLPQMADDDSRYLANAAYETANPLCTVENSAGYRTADPDSEYWKTRDLVEHAKGTDTPLLFTQGLLEFVTEPDGVEEFLANNEGPERGWIGQWGHSRGNDRDENGRLMMGREGWFDETMAHFDTYLKGIEPAVDYPAFAIQDSTGSWRAEDSWPVTNASSTISLRGGSYVDDGAEGDPAVEMGNSFTQWSEPVAVATRITGRPEVTLKTRGNGNVMVNLYDVAPDGTAVMFDEQVSVISKGTTSFGLKSTDWTLAPGHTLAVKIGTIESGAVSNWIDTPTNEKIRVNRADLSIAVSDPASDNALSGAASTFLPTYVLISTSKQDIGSATFKIPPAAG